MREAYEAGSRADAWREVISGLTWALGSSELRYTSVIVDGFDEDAAVRVRIFTDDHLVMVDVAGDQSKRDTSTTILSLSRLRQLRLLRTPSLAASEPGYATPKRMRLELTFEGAPENIEISDEQAMPSSSALADYSETLISKLR